MKDTVKINKSKTLMIAHRGASALERENTCSAFVAAANRSYYGIETDIHKTADGNYIIIHDDNAKRVSGEDAVIEENEYSYLRSITLFDTDGRKCRADLIMPSLVEYIAVCQKYGKIAVLELKNAFSEEQIYEICEIIDGAGYMGRMIFISFHYDNLVYLRKKYPDVRAQYLRSEYDPSLIQKLKDANLDIDIKHTALTKDIIDTFHREGIVVNCWTVDDPGRAEELASYGVDMITTNVLE